MCVLLCYLLNGLPALLLTLVQTAPLGLWLIPNLCNDYMLWDMLRQCQSHPKYYHLMGRLDDKVTWLVLSDKALRARGGRGRNSFSTYPSCMITALGHVAQWHLCISCLKLILEDCAGHTHSLTVHRCGWPCHHSPPWHNPFCESYCACE